MDFELNDADQMIFLQIEPGQNIEQETDFRHDNEEIAEILRQIREGGPSCTSELSESEPETETYDDKKEKYSDLVELLDSYMDDYPKLSTNSGDLLPLEKIEDLIEIKEELSPIEVNKSIHLEKEVFSPIADNNIIVIEKELANGAEVNVTNETEEISNGECQMKSLEKGINHAIELKSNAKNKYGHEYTTKKNHRSCSKIKGKSRRKRKSTIDNKYEFKICPLCFKTIKSRFFLHLNKHVGKRKLFICDLCTMNSEKRDTYFHTKNHHEQALSPYDCAICLKTHFRNKQNFKNLTSSTECFFCQLKKLNFNHQQLKSEVKLEKDFLNIRIPLKKFAMTSDTLKEKQSNREETMEYEDEEAKHRLQNISLRHLDVSLVSEVHTQSKMDQ